MYRGSEQKKSMELLSHCTLILYVCVSLTYIYLMKIIFKENMYKILNVLFIVIRTHFIFCTCSLLESDVFSSYFIYSRKSDLQVARNTKVERDAKKLLGFITNNVSLSIDLNSMSSLYTWPESNA